MRKRFSVVGFVSLLIVLAMLYTVMVNMPIATLALSVCGAILLSKFISPLQSSNIAHSKGLATEIWVADIQETLWDGNEFIQKSVDHTENIVHGIVHLPQAGSAPNAEVNRSVVPATIGTRTDADLTYAMDEFTTDPVRIPNIESIQLSYSKRSSVMGQHIATLKDMIARRIAWKWSTNATIRTSGAAVATALAPGATGTRKAITVEDFAKLAAKFDNDLMPKTGRYLVMPPDMYYQLFGIQDIIRADSFGKATLGDGVVRELLGFKIMTRTGLPVFDASGNLKALGAASAATDNLGVIAWSQYYVARAEGAVNIFSDSGDNGNGRPEYYAPIISALVMMGSTKLRNDNKGFATLVQTA